MKAQLSIFFTCTLLFFAACSDRNNPTRNSSKEINELKINVLSEDMHAESPYIRLIAEYEDWIIADIVHDGLENDSSRSFVFMSQNEQIGYYLYATPSYVLMSQFTDDPTESLMNGNVLLTSFDDKYTYVRVVKNLFGNIEILSTKAVPNENAAPKMPQRNNDYFTGLGKSIYESMSKHFKAGAEEISDATGVLAWLPNNIGGAGSTLGSIWSALAFSASLHQIYDYNPELKEALNENIEVDTRFYVKMALSSDRYLALAIKAFDWISSKTEIGKEWLSDGELEVENGDYGSVQYPMFSSSRMINSNNNVQIISTLKPAYIVRHSVSNITETSAEVHVSIETTGSQSYFSSMGVVYTNYITGEKKEVALSSYGQTVTLSGLEPCTSYMCYAYVKTIGETYTSSAELFTTEGQLQLIPSSLNFSSKGGKEIVMLSISEEHVASLSVTGPGWCQLSYNSPAGAFIVTVPESEKERDGVVKVNVKLLGGETKTAQLPIAQTSNTWDNTNWVFGGNVTTTGFGESSTQYAELTLRINSIANNDYSLSSAGTNLSCHLSEDSNHVLNGSFSYSMQDVTATWSMTIQRTGATTATCAIDFSNGGIHQYGTLNGTLIE